MPRGGRHRLGNSLAIALLLAYSSLMTIAQTPSRPPGEIAWAIRYDPRTYDPAKVDDQASELIRYLTAGVLLRTDRRTLQPIPELAASWTLSPDGKLITFHLRNGLQFSDGSHLQAKDVAWSLRRVLDPATAAPVAAEFLAAKDVRVETPAPLTVRVLLPRRVIGIANVFDEIAIEPAERPASARITAGPFVLGETKPGQSVRLLRNPHYWKHDAAGVALPYAPSIRLDVLANREQELARFDRGEYDLIDGLAPDAFALMARRHPGAAKDLGASLNTEQMWFNQAPGAPLPAFEKSWFITRAFRVAVAQAIHRADLARIAYDSHATPAHGYISPANIPWYNPALHDPHEDTAEALRLLAGAGFHKQNNVLTDAGGHAVKFSILTNAGNAARGKMATLIQQDLLALGMQVTVVTLDYPALIERLMHTQEYEACLLGLTNVDPDPNSMMNQWMSSSPNHQWSPSEKTPATAWEAEIDSLMQAQAANPDPKARKQAIDRVQQIVADQQPFIYLVHPNTLYAISPRLLGIQPTVIQPGLVWNIEMLHRQDAPR